MIQSSQLLKWSSALLCVQHSTSCLFNYVFVVFVWKMSVIKAVECHTISNFNNQLERARQGDIAD